MKPDDTEIPTTIPMRLHIALRAKGTRMLLHEVSVDVGVSPTMRSITGDIMDHVIGRAAREAKRQLPRSRQANENKSTSLVVYYRLLTEDGKRRFIRRGRREQLIGAVAWSSIESMMMQHVAFVAKMSLAKARVRAGLPYR
mgnify:CR=1 FL=1